jgi:hypothetical protein
VSVVLQSFSQRLEKKLEAKSQRNFFCLAIFYFKESEVVFTKYQVVFCFLTAPLFIDMGIQRKVGNKYIWDWNY